MDHVTKLAKKLWGFHLLNHEIEKADCIIGLGSYDLRVAKKCADLYLNNFSQTVVFSGKHGNWTKTLWNKTEAEIFSEHAIEFGLERKAIKLEKESTNLGENALFTRQLLSGGKISVKTAIVVTKPNTQRRAYATFKKVWPQLNLKVTSENNSFEEQIGKDVSKTNLIHEMVGDIQRIMEYPKLEFQIEQHIPDEVINAYEGLVLLGYNQHLIHKKS